jgi:predicted nucleotidyltransferase
MGELADRRLQTRGRLAQLREELKEAEELADGKACVYATGSFGRCEASAHSDLDLFILGKRNGKVGPDGMEGSLLRGLDEICIKADLIEVTRKLGIPEFSGDGRYLTHYSVHEFTRLSERRRTMLQTHLRPAFSFFWRAARSSDRRYIRKT